MSKKILAMFMATAMAATTFFGCGSTEEASKKDEGSSTTSTDEDASTKTDDEKVTLEVAVSGSAQEIAIHQQKFDLYMKEHPNVTIKPVDIGSERFQKLMTLIGADNAPDIIYLNEWTYVMANKGVLLGLNDLIEQEQFDTSVYPESLLTPLRYEGELYALPQEVSPFVIYYNKEMFEAANVPLPTDDWTIDEFYAAAEALTDPAEKVYGYRHPGAWADQVLGWLSRAGVDFDISGKEVKSSLVAVGIFNAFGTFLLRQFFLTIPKELEEAAKIDGCSYPRIFWEVILKNSKPALMTLIIFTFMNTWNDFLRPLIFINSEEKWTLAMGLAQFQGTYVSQWNQMMAGALISMLPILLVYIFAQKYFVQGIVMSGIKG